MVETHWPGFLVAATLLTRASSSGIVLQEFRPVSTMAESRSVVIMPFRIGWKWVSLMPGIRVRPARSMTLVWSSISWSMSALEPTNTILLPLTPTASAISSFALTVMTLPFLKAMSRYEKSKFIKASFFIQRPPYARQDKLTDHADDKPAGHAPRIV